MFIVSYTYNGVKESSDPIESYKDAVDYAQRVAKSHKVSAKIEGERPRSRPAPKPQQAPIERDALETELASLRGDFVTLLEHISSSRTLKELRAKVQENFDDCPY